MATFLEGVESVGLACSLVVIVPCVLIVLVARETRPIVAIAALVGVATMMWARAGRLWEIESDGITTVVISAVIIGPSLGIVRTERRRAAATYALVAGAVAGWLWQPCVGGHFRTDRRNETERADHRRESDTNEDGSTEHGGHFPSPSAEISRDSGQNT